MLFPEQKDVKNVWMPRIDKSLKQFTETLTNNVEGAYNKNNEKYITFDKTNGTELVRDMAQKLEKMLGKKMAALKRVVEKAEDAVIKHKWDPNLKWDPDEKKTDVKYYDAKDEQQLSGMLAYNERFLQPINDSVSTVHIPVEIYKGDIEILNGLKWSNELDEVFRKNYEEDEDILWQYFGSQTGFMRTFPGSKWSLKDKVDLFDVRRRPWYTQGSSSPKDMLILIDTSGSVHGQALNLIKVAVKSILDTLGENDFVYIANFSKMATNVSCFDTFVQANYRNKKILKEGVDRIQAKEMANFDNAVSYAFDQFDKFNRSGLGGANCNKMIMLLTDGGTDDAEPVFQERNFKREEKDRIRVFTYAVGQTANPNRGIKWMACANRGKFSEIPAMGAIRARVQEYTFVLAKTFKPEGPLWSSVYLDKTGLGMMTTVTLPVYNKTNDHNRKSNQTILGVMGTDVTTKQMDKFTPKWKLGPNGYSFAINANGYVMFHPKLRVHEDFKDPPNMDFLDIEVENEKKVQLRKNMTDGKAGETELETYVISVDMNHTHLETRHYFYTNINKTSFSLGIAYPSYQQYTIGFNNVTENIVTDGTLFQEDNLTTMLIADWDYFVNMSSKANQSGTIRDIYNAYKDWESKNKSADFWNDDRLLHLYWDIKKTNEVSWYYKEYPNLDSSAVNWTEASFIATYGGLTRIYPANSRHVETLQKYNDTWKASYFKRALDYDGFIFTAPYTLKARSDNESVPDIMVTKSITIKHDIKPAVVGGFVKHEKIFNILSAGTDHYCREDSNVTCYLLDDGAFMISSNQRDKWSQVGRFFGYIDKVLMSELYNISYRRLEHLDFQATCSNNDGTVSSAIRLRVPSFAFLFELLTVNWWTSFWTWTVTNLSLHSWLYPPVVEAAKQDNGYHNCIKRQAQYYIPKEFEETSGKIRCTNNCTRDYIAVKLTSSNLVLVIVGHDCPDCTVESMAESLIHEPVTFEEETSYFCNMKPRYRRATEACYDYHKMEDDDDCGGPLSTPVSMAVIIVATILTVLFTWMR